ncbi:beta-propeller fold lactonase family protein [Aminobacter sp. AP02]|uniref:lactonase family protein n=1 Tax=Aminobacter sp. AP02 TaxID=2135737 RepID=UPI000D6C45CE|nr:beta-propeller fold lactonase family protein [Aminobacter sp. AP02]PWK61297.1 6-phosphogluconolactonase [Aminobacter sp. AP02]
MPVGRVYGYLAHGSRKLSVLAMSPKGEFTQIQEVAINDSDVPEGVRAGRFTALCVSPDRRYLFASNRTAPYSIRSFAINRDDGTLTLLSETPTVESSPFLSTDRTGRFLLAAHNPPDRNRRTGFVTVSVINDGFLQPPHQIIRTPPKTHAIRADSSNRFVLAPACDADVVVRFGFNEATGMLDPNILSTLVMRPETGPRHYVFHPNNRYVYTLNEYDGAVYVYSFDPRDGAMSEIQVAFVRHPDIKPGENVRAGDLHITPNGKFLYAAVRGSCTMAGLKIDPATGLVSVIGHTPVDKEPRGFNIDPFGRFLVVNGLMTNTAVTYAIEPSTGELNKVASFSSMEDPNWIELVCLS